MRMSLQAVERVQLGEVVSQLGLGVRMEDAQETGLVADVDFKRLILGAGKPVPREHVESDGIIAADGDGLQAD